MDTVTGKELFSSSEGSVDIPYLSLNRDGTRLAFYESDRGLVVWDVDRKQSRGPFPVKGQGKDVVTLLDPDGKRLLSVSEGLIWDVATPDRDPTPTTKTKLRSEGKIALRCSFSSDGSRLAMVESGSGDSEIVSIWDVATGKRRASLAVNGSISSLAFSPDGKRLYGRGQSLYAWDGAYGDSLTARVLQAESTGSQLTCSPDGKLLAVWFGGGSPGGHVVRILDAGSGVEQRVLESRDFIRTAAFSKDSKRLITLGYSGDVTTPNRMLCKEWVLEVVQPRLDLPKGKPRPKVDEEVTVRSRDGQRQVSYTPGKPNVTVRDHEGKVIHVFEKHENKTWYRTIQSIAFSPNERYVMSRDNSGQLAVWEPDTGKIQRRSTEVVDPGRSPHAPWIFSSQPVVSPDGRVLFIHEGKEVKAVNFDDLTDRFSLGEVNGLWFSPDGKRLLAYRRSRKDEKETVPGGIQLWDIASNTLIASQKSNVAMEALESDGVAAYLHADCRHLLVQEGEGSTAIWDTQTLEKPLVLQGDPTAFKFLQFSPDGERLATLDRPNQDRTQETVFAKWKSTPGWLVWDVNARKVLFRLPGPRRVVNVHGDVCPWIAFSPDSQRIATMNWVALSTSKLKQAKANGGSIRIGVTVLDATTGQELLELNPLSNPKTSVAIVAPRFGVPPHMADFWLAFSPDGSRLSVNYGDSGVFRGESRVTRRSRPDGIPFLTWDATPRKEPKR